MAFAFDNLTSLVDQTCRTFNKVLPGNFTTPSFQKILSIGELKNGLLRCHKVFLPEELLLASLMYKKNRPRSSCLGSNSWELWMVQVQETLISMIYTLKERN